ncbi:MAG: HDIG domain-containing protein [Deltaproteobacteria bacterium]|nr:HDIG domain-containing protein [Deltaproteobacteria bacterium]MBW2053911.1 HDIG domain-containing protein [Deltaproteobacteria bacterium]MBW2142083.1 HDIG domain-containing protein [Deltaproteobacteria bacterium]MBW2324109.1 HDIG domain-containing protein [Deltaproteobacteria bacterium]
MHTADHSVIPDYGDCMELMTRYQMPAHVVRHSQVVSVLALHMAQGFKKTGISMDLGLVRASGLLHDITKMYSFDRPLDHALTGAKLLKKLGYARVAEIVRQHVRLSPSRPPGRISEAEVVNYADKRVVNDQVTSLAERCRYIINRYAKTPEARSWIDLYTRKIFELEMEIFSIIPGGPDQLLNLNTDPDELPRFIEHALDDS